MFFRRRLFSLTRLELRYAAWMHIGRIAAGVLISAVIWHLALPAVALGWWLVLATMRQLITRLPLISNKDIVFAAVAVFLVGEQDGIGALMALIAGLTLATNILVAMGLGLEQLWRG